MPSGVDLLSETWEPIENIPQECIDEFRGLQAAEEGEEIDGDDYLTQGTNDCSLDSRHQRRSLGAVARSV
jgi:hypothetical protein